MKKIKEFIFSCIVFLNSVQEEVIHFISLKKRVIKIGILVEEFFHNELGGFGGYGITVKNVVGFFNTPISKIAADVFLTRIYSHSHIEVKRYYDTDVIFRPKDVQSYVLNFFQYSSLARKRNLDFFLTIDWYPSYEYTALALPKTPLVIWIKDPRSTEEWEKISGVPLEFSVIGKNYESGQIADIVSRKRNSIQKILRISEFYNRKVIFAAQTRCLVERAQRSYGLSSINAFFLPNPTSIEGVEHPQFSTRPSVCLLGRLEPIKRPWIFFELAKRFPNVDFLVAGKSHFPEVMDPIIKQYKNLPNLKFLGMVTGREKHDLLNSIWALINTSIHEALPVSFLEAFCYCKPVISCQNPDNLAGQFGFSTGEILGEGLEEKSLAAFSQGIEQMISKKEERVDKGLQARRFVKETYSFLNFKKCLNENVRGPLGIELDNAHD